MKPKNNWQRKRVKLGLRIVELAKYSGLSAKTIARLESEDPTITEVTKSKVRIALSKAETRA